ncbi:E3 ubiquitin-protein ligase SINA-like 10 [Camellia lanceoleosa]|uniref:E3 ubiquitin-protein ligase SINA-like 10 n=1 Tax=Camellia lanceoleosa TaxID=1840588 RepID=A0ACC0I271_9ERIC|nr:E3 ubiquitin-protein ligase SINA-like 10 [Camellia lanceoleosa]
MAKFSVGREDESEGPSSPRPKKLRTTTTTPPQPQQQQQFRRYDQPVVEEEEDEDEEAESEYDDDDDDDEDDEDDDETEAERSHAVRVSLGSSGDGSISVTLTDPDVLDCPICLEHLTIPVFQCENGHVACSSCCFKLGNQCPSCSWPIGYNRCRAIEKVIESVKISCQNMKYGCKEAVSYSKKHDHEETCVYVPSSSYPYTSSAHFRTPLRFCYNCLFPISIEKQQICLILHEHSECGIFFLNNGIDPLGNIVNVSCIGPSSTKRAFAYDLIARNGGSSVRLQSFTESIPGRVEHPPLKRFLLVPSDFVGSCRQLKLELCIRRNQEFPAHI